MQWFVLACLAVACLVQVQAVWYQRWIYRPDYRTYRTNYLSRSTTKFHKCLRTENGLFCFSSYQLPANCMTSGRDNVVCTQQGHYYRRTPYRRRYYSRPLRPIRIKPGPARRRYYRRPVRPVLPYHRRPRPLPLILKYEKPAKQKKLKPAKQNNDTKNSKVAKSSKGGKSD
ncbi:hypothetical protein GCK32_020342 [Trichostrongylus colubriformis]|uniref:Uncharacterized protein n=1 Tax=Trichostrongylus colubriformis TaxID=6319 RepID=A0AAN8IFP8_TRICO